jgi:hypothetical protein
VRQLPRLEKRSGSTPQVAAGSRVAATQKTAENKAYLPGVAEVAGVAGGHSRARAPRETETLPSTSVGSQVADNTVTVEKFSRIGYINILPLDKTAQHHTQVDGKGAESPLPPWAAPVFERPANPATSATSLLKPAEILDVSGSSPAATCCYPAATEPDWTDDRSWILDIRSAGDETAKLSVLAAWVAAAGGETTGRTVTLRALRPPRERRLAEVELRRMCEQVGLEILEDEPA